MATWSSDARQRGTAAAVRGPRLPAAGRQGAARRLAHATDGAVVEAAATGSRPGAGSTSVERLIAELPFETSRGYSASLGRRDGSAAALAVKGAPETSSSAA